MFRLIRRRDQERGAVAVIVAVLVGGFVLTGVAALTIDAGSLYAERRVLQNAADAASLALAQVCAAGDSEKCSASWPGLKDLADLNSPDGVTDIDSVCFSTDECATIPVDPAVLVQCTRLPPDLEANVKVKWVEVRTKTRSTTAPPSVVRKYFANLSDPSYDGKSVKACARAAWGPARVGKATLPFTFSQCEWVRATGFSSDPDAPPALYGADHETFLGLNYQDSPCETWNGHDYPGAFGWTDRNDDCTVDIVNGDWLGSVTSDSNGSGAKACSDEIYGHIGDEVLIPVFDCVDQGFDADRCEPTNAKANYHIVGLAGFHITAIRGFGATMDGGVPGAGLEKACKDTSKGQKCLYGYFIEKLVPVSEIGDSETEDLGGSAVQVAG